MAQLTGYYIKYKGGIASRPNQHLKPRPFHGPGQGAGDSPGRWGYISDALVRAYKKRCHGAVLIGPLSQREILGTIQVFVDSSSIFLIAPDENGTTAEELLTHKTQLWEQFLHASGGKLELSKCKFTVMQWDFDSAGRPLLQVQDSKTHNFEINNSDKDQAVHVEYINPDTAYKLLGVWIAMDGNMIEQEKALRTKCSKMASVYSQCPMSASDAQQGYSSVFLPSITYPLAATHIFWDKLELIQSSVTSVQSRALDSTNTFPEQ
jgi:hypothetical protein